MHSIILAAIFFTAACALAYADELRAVAGSLVPASAPLGAHPVRVVAAPPPRSMLDSLVRDLEAPDPKRVSRALERLPQYPPGELSRHLVPLLDGPVTETRDRVADLLLRHGGEDVLEPLHRYFLEREAEESEDLLPPLPASVSAFPTAQAQGRLGTPGVPAKVIPLHRGRRPRAEFAAEDPERGPQVGDVTFPPEVLSPEPELRAKALSDLAGSGHPHARELLCRVATSDPEGLVRGVAAAALGRLPNHADSQASLGRATQDSDPAVRWNACYALGKLGSRQAKRALRFAENDSDGSVRLAARKALEALGLDPPMPRVEQV
jgi:HEAT repeat protein